MSTQPTAVLVHGAFADASGYAGVIRRSGPRVSVRAPMNPLRGLASDAEAIAVTRPPSRAHRPCRSLLRRRCHLPGRARP